jgi:hypothetical protein
VLGVDRASALTPLDDDVAPQVLQDSYAEIRRGAVGQARERLLAAGAEQQAGRAALALAYGFETEGDFARAAAIYERVTQRTNDSNVLARHVIALTNTALFTGDRAILTRAHWLARRAVEKGARAAPLLGPIAPYVEWDSPTLSALGFGGARVAQRGEPDEVVTDVTQLRAAVLDKPPLARWFSAETSSSLVESPSQLAVTSLCFDRQGAREGCRFEPEIDGARVSCLPAAQVEVASPNDDVARPHRCQFMVPRGARRLRWVTNGGDPLGWLLLEAPDTAGSWQSLPQTLSYTETTPNVPLLLDLAGPAVLRVTARGKPGATGRVEVRVFGAGDHPVGEARVLELPSAADPGAQRLDVPTPLGRSVSGIVLIEGKGQHRVSIASNSSEVLIRPELARVRTPDVIAQPPAPIMANAEAVVNQEGAFALELPRVGPRATPGGVTVSADLALVDQVKTEEAVHEVRTEAGVTVRKALIEDQLWVRTELQGRLRGGPPSAALEAYVSWAARETSPGFFALVRATMQERAGERFFETPEELGGGSVSERRTGVGLGYFASFGASHSLPLSERLSLLPSVAAIFREADNSVRGMRGVDSQVYSYYSWIHPRSWDAQLSLIYRMRYDSVLQSALQVRLNPDLDGVDNWQGALIWKWLGGAGYWPWISWQTQLTWYEQSALRELAFARLHTSPAATFWRWLGNGDRVRATLACGAQWDEPSPDFVQPALFASIGVGYDFSAEQGLRDFVPFERPFRRRLEEGSKRQTTRSTGSNPYWGWEPAP